MSARSPWLGLSLIALTMAAQGGILPARQYELQQLLHQDCGSCHGLTLRGGLGPPLLPESLAGKPRDFLIATILYGRPGTAMPPWQPFLGADEAAWLVDLLMANTEISR